MKATQNASCPPMNAKIVELTLIITAEKENNINENYG